MSEALPAPALASLLAGISAAAFVCSAFYPVLAAKAKPSRGKMLADIMERAGRRAASASTREAKRAQAIALELVADERRAKQATRLEIKLAHAGLGWSVRRYAISACALGVALLIAFLAMGQAPGASLAATLLGAVLTPAKALDFLAQKRRRRFLQGFGAAIDMIVRGARSGLSLNDCLGMVASDAAPAVRREFSPIVAQLRAGIPLAAAIEKLASQMPIAEVRFFALVLTIQSQTGGNLTDALTNLSGMLRERERLAAKVRTASAEVRASAIAIGSLPFIVVGATAFLSPDYIAFLWREEAGHKLLAFCLIWLALGIAVLRRMARIEP